MESILRRALVELGCSHREVKFYLAALALGPSPISNIASRAKLSRSTAYIIAEQLIERKLIIQDYQPYKKHLSAISPRHVLRQLEAKHRRLGRSTISLKGNIAEIENFYSTDSTVPIVKTYRGLSAVMAVQNDIMRSNTEVLLWTNQSAERSFFTDEQRQTFISQRIKQKINIRVLAVANDEGRQLIASDDTSFRKTRLLPEEVHFTPETYIYNDQIAVIDYDNDIFGVIIKNRLIAESQRAIFEHAWNSQD